MSERSTRAGPLWDRLRRNRDRNAPIFADAGIRPESAAALVCPACGAEESALFWSTTRRRSKTMYLLCPICEAAHVRYNLAGNRVVDPVFNRRSVSGGLGVVFLLIGVGALFYFRDTEPVRALMDDAYLARTVIATGFHRAMEGRFGGYTAPPPAHTGAPSGWGGAGGSGSSPSASRAGGGASAPRGGSHAAPTQWSPRPPAATTPEVRGASTSLYQVQGDQRTAIEAYAAEVAARQGGEASALREIRYDSATGMTYVVVDSGAAGWQRWLGARPGGRRVDR